MLVRAATGYESCKRHKAFGGFVWLESGGAGREPPPWAGGAAGGAVGTEPRPAAPGSAWWVTLSLAQTSRSHAALPGHFWC